jgi:transketolase N-terminal domain/subunit
MTTSNNYIKIYNRLIDITYRHKLSHLSSCITSLPIIYNIYSSKNPDDKFVLSNGHAGLALYVVLEHFYGVDAEMLVDKHGIHPCLDKENYIDCSTGSLGLGLPVAVGYAMANRDREVHCLISDGESFEGSIWESLNFIHNKKINNINVHANVNGFSAYDEVDVVNLCDKLKLFLPSINIHRTSLQDIPFLDSKHLEAHYYVLRSEQERDALFL